ncbi:hypothetical protein [Labrenzia sp. VG12]|uniref:hypothetical protein n=1 Tax=Labrenzia sp. VG12 TaxID=2021862 RepID=UPI001AD8EB33|nr:hypothetical protein [Labrenzia sp. VG12]
MHSFRHFLFVALLMFLCLVSSQPVRADLVAAANATKIVSLTPLRNGVSAITLVWPINPPTQDRVGELMAGLSSVISGGTSEHSPNDIDALLRIKGIENNITINGRDLLLTVSAADDVFPEALAHLENVLFEPEYTSGWYARELQELKLRISSNTGRPSDVLNEAGYFVLYDPRGETTARNDGRFRFGRPSQVILRSADEEAGRRAIRMIKALPEAQWTLPFARWAKALTGQDKQAFALPAGTIHFADPDSTEMLILFVKAEEFEDEVDQIGANLLMDYVGGNQGSELFRIIRQEMRAAYDPRTDFIVMGKNRAIVSLSATVEAQIWPEIHEKMRAIYEGARTGKISLSGLDIQHDRLNRRYAGRFFSDPVWGARHYLNEYPAGASGTINLPLLTALETVPLEEVIASSQTHLPPLDDFLLILIGGGPAPAEALKTRGYCALPKNAPLHYCLEELSNTLN